METVLKLRKKLKVGEVKVGETFRLIEKMQCFLVIDLTKTDMFKNATPEQPPILRDDVVYVVDIVTGIVEVFPNNMEVYLTPVRAEEIV